MWESTHNWSHIFSSVKEDTAAEVGDIEDEINQFTPGPVDILASPLQA